MFTLSALPTDNFYKFFSLSGVVIVLFCIGFPINRTIEVRALVAQAEGEADILQLESQWLDQDLLRTKNEVDALEADVKVAEQQSRTDAKLVASLEARMKDAVRERDTLRSTKRDVSRRSEKLRAKARELRTLVRDLYFLTPLAFGSAAGIWMASWGFRRWYQLLQRPLDELLAYQLMQEAQRRRSIDLADK